MNNGILAIGLIGVFLLMSKKNEEEINNRFDAGNSYEDPGQLVISVNQK